VNHDKARSGVGELFAGRGKRLPELRSHLEGCPDCRNHYDRTALAFRSLGGRPDEMTAEELALFGAVFPQQAPAPARWPMLWLGGLAAAAAALVVFVQHPPSEFNARGGPALATQSSARALCSRITNGDLVVGDAASCTDGDRLSFVALPKGPRFVAVGLVDQANKFELVIGGSQGALEAGQTEVVLPSSTTFRPGMRAVAIYANAPIHPAVVEKCAREECPASLERRDVPLGKTGP
jgi:hypothetical protein